MYVSDKKNGGAKKAARKTARKAGICKPCGKKGCTYGNPCKSCVKKGCKKFKKPAKKTAKRRTLFQRLFNM